MLLLLTIVTHSTIAQQGKQYDNANDQYERKHYQQASKEYIQLYNKNQDAVLLARIADCLAKKGDAEGAISWYQKALESEVQLDENQQLDYAEQLLIAGENEKAASILNSYQGEDSIRYNKILVSLNQYADFKINEENYEWSPLSINTPLSEYGIMRYDSGYLFASNRAFDGKEQKESEYNYFDLYYVKTDDFVTFSEISVFEDDFDAKGNDGPIAFFPGEQKAIVSRNNYHRGIRGVTHRGKNEIELYEIDKLADGSWDKMKRLPFDSDEFSSFHPTINSDGSQMIFSSTRPGGFGGADLYSVNYENGTWSEPVNLGPNINTFGNELFPNFINDSSIHFSSNGWPGMGGMDLYKTSLENANAENLGSPFNSRKDDFTILALDEMRFVIASDRELEAGNDDLYLVTLKQRIQKEVEPVPEKTINLSYDLWYAANTKAPVNGLLASTQDTSLFEVRGDSLFLFSNGESSVESLGNSDAIEVISGIYSIESKNIINPVFFDFNQITSDTSLSETLDFMAQFPDIKVELIGYSDTKGPAGYNLELSNQRASFVKTKLVSTGVKSQTISVIGKGEEDAIFDCKNGCTEEQNKSERRVEFRLVK